MVEVTMISVLFLMTDSYCLWKTQFTEQTFSIFPSNWEITGAYSGNRLSDCSGTTIIGGYWIAGAGSVIHGSYSNLPNHSGIKARLKVYYIDSWDTEVATINVAGYVTQRTWYLDWGWSDMCGAGFRDGYFWETLQGAHTTDSFNIYLSNNLNDDAGNGTLKITFLESLGLKDVEIYVQPVQCVQFFSECNYTGTMKELCEGSPNLDRTNMPQKIKSIRLHGCGQVKLTKKGSSSITITENTPCLTEFDFPPVENLNR